MVSVGVVAESDYLYKETRDLEQIFLREVKNNAWIEDHLITGKPNAEPFRVTGEFSYRSRYSAANGLVLTGDAFGFLDPVFSSGLFFALRGGELVADAVDAALTAEDYSAARFSDYADEMRSGMEAMRRLVYAFYDHGFSFGDLLKEHPQLGPDLTDCLIGNLSRDFEPLFEGCLKVRGCTRTTASRPPARRRLSPRRCEKMGTVPSAKQVTVFVPIRFRAARRGLSPIFSRPLLR